MEELLIGTAVRTSNPTPKENGTTGKEKCHTNEENTWEKTGDAGLMEDVESWTGLVQANLYKSEMLKKDGEDHSLYN